mgnify:CR=1 FL=1
MVTKTILIIGASGQLGSVLTKELQKIYGKKNVIASDIFLDTDFDGIFEVIDATDFDAMKTIINKYSKIDLSSIQNEELKKIMSIIESKFHGNSSGFDPLVSFFNKPIMLSAGNIKLLDNLKFPNFKIYLIDSEISSSTSEMIELFNQKQNQKDFLSVFNSSFNFSIKSFFSTKLSSKFF